MEHWALARIAEPTGNVLKGIGQSWLFIGMPVINLVIALFAAGAAWKSARAAQTSAHAAQEQTKLQRPRPVVIVEGSWNLEGSGGGSEGFVVENAGSSPAFDVEISDVEGPLLAQVQYRERLITDPIRILKAGAREEASHHRQTPGNALDNQAALRFVQNAGRAFSTHDEQGNPTLVHDVRFFLAYSTPDGRRIETPCLIRFNLGTDRLRAQIVPVSSWLGTEARQGPSKLPSRNKDEDHTVWC